MSGPDGPREDGDDQRRLRPGRRALFSDSDAESAAPVAPGLPGRRAFFSETAEGLPADDRPPAVDPEEVRPGFTTVVVVCRTCLARTPVSVLRIGPALIPSLWLPTRKWSRLMRCPACRRVSWCRIEWPTLRG